MENAINSLFVVRLAKQGHICPGTGFHALRHDGNIIIHQDKVTEAATHDKEMKDFVGSEVFVFIIKNREL